MQVFVHIAVLERIIGRLLRRCHGRIQMLKMTAKSHANLKRVCHLGSGGGSGDGRWWRRRLASGARRRSGILQACGSKLKLTWAAAPHSCGHSPHRSATPSPREAEIRQINAYVGFLIPQLASVVLPYTVANMGNRQNQADRIVSRAVNFFMISVYQ